MKLHGGDPYWPLASGLISVAPPLEQDVDCDVLVVGAGITGALVAHGCAEAGLRVVVLDRRDIGAGSTSASTALLQYEIDVPLLELGEMIGVEGARRAYRLGLEAIAELERVSHASACGFERGPSLQVARDGEGAEFLRRECGARREAGLGVRWLDAGELREAWGVHGAGGIVSDVAARLDPYRLAHGLLGRVSAAGGMVRDRTRVTAVERRGGCLEAGTDRGGVVRARWMVLACGYETSLMIPEDVVTLHSTYALISEPCAEEFAWPEGALIWEYAEAYLYARPVGGGRLMVGGEDEPFENAGARDALIDEKGRKILERFRGLVPGIALEAAFCWAGTFGRTKDGLGYIGTPGNDPRVLCALGFGGNGITLGAVAGRLVPEMIRAGDRGVELGDESAAAAKLFRFGR